MHTLSEENYLKAIYNFAQKGSDQKITPTAVAEALGNNPASVVDMFKKLAEKQLIEYDKQKGARLTKPGKAIATLVVRKHRLWEVFLVDKLNYGWEQIHDIAEQLEHVSDNSLADRLDKFLGYPEYDPHGDPIPKANGKMPDNFASTLAEGVVGATCRVAAVKDTSTEFLTYLQRLKIKIGTEIKVVEKILFDNSLVIQIANGADTVVSSKFGESILVANR